MSSTAGSLLSDGQRLHAHVPPPYIANVATMRAVRPRRPAPFATSQSSRRQRARLPRRPSVCLSVRPSVLHRLLRARGEQTRSRRRRFVRDPVAADDNEAPIRRSGTACRTASGSVGCKPHDETADTACASSAAAAAAAVAATATLHAAAPAAASAGERRTARRYGRASCNPIIRRYVADVITVFRVVHY